MGGALGFETRLVGVPYDQSNPEQYSKWGGQGWRTNFTWNSNAAHGVSQPIGWGAVEGAIQYPIIAGGIFNVRFDDNSLVPGFPVTPPPLNSQPEVERIVYANGQTQRSKFIYAQVFFNDLVTIRPGAFQLFLNNKPFTVSSFFTTTIDNKTVATIQFPSKLISSYSLPEGRYRLVTRASHVKNLQQQTMEQNHTDNFFRLFGDVNGDGRVDSTDQTVFNTAFGKKSNQLGYLWYLDFDGNGKIDAKDRKAFNARLGKSMV